MAVCLLGLVLVVVGFFGPWVPHETAALTVAGPELAEFAKFFPQVQNGAVRVTRGLFLTPVTAAAAVLGLVASCLPVRPVVRLIVTGVAVLLALAALPPYEYLNAPEYRVHLLLVACGVGLALVTLLAHRLSRRAWGVLIALLALAGAIPALHQYTLLRPLIVALYNAPVGLGWGLIAFAVGSVLLLACGILAAMRSGRAAG